MKLFKQLWCRHSSIELLKQIYGDPIIFEYGYKRSVWKCKDCGKILYSESLTQLK